MGIDLETVRKEVKQTGTGSDQKMFGTIPFTPRVKKVLDFARREAKNLNHTYIGTEHLLLGLLREGDGIAAQVLRNLGVNLEQMRLAILKELDPNIELAVTPQKEEATPAHELPKKWKSIKYHFGDNFTPRALQVLGLAYREADRLHLNCLGTEHVLFGLIELGKGVAANVLISHGLNPESVRAEVERLARGSDEKPLGRIPYTPRAKKVLDLARQEAKTLHHTYIGTEHLLLGLLREPEGPAAEIFKKFRIDMEKARIAILKELDPIFPSGGD
jgi:ATP-dependent Clp protease ATP-binding subunit ClpA